MNDKINRYNGLRRELLTVEAQLAEHKRAYLVDGVHCPLPVRTTLEARQAALRLEIHTLRPAITEMHEAAKRQKSKTFLHELCQLCKANGMEHLVDQARDTSRRTIEELGLTEAYRVTA